MTRKSIGQAVAPSF